MARLFAVAVFVAAFVCWGAFAGQEGQPAPTESPTPPAAAQSKTAAQVRQADDADLVVKEWHSPITFDLDAGWLRSLPLGGTARIEDLPSFYCDGVTLDRMEAKRSSEPTTETVDVRLQFHLRARRHGDDKIVALEFTLLTGEQQLLLGRRDELELSAGDSESWSVQFKIPKETSVAYTTDGSSPRLRVSMIVQND